MKKTYTVNRRELIVSGFLWSGSRCEHVYSFNENEEPKTLADAKRIAGDFESLEKATVKNCKQTIIEEIKRKTLK